MDAYGRGGNFFSSKSETFEYPAYLDVLTRTALVSPRLLHMHHVFVAYV